MSDIYEGQRVSEATLDASFLPGPAEDLVPKTLLAMSLVPQFAALFGPYTPGSESQRWSDYQKSDWSLRQLPAIAVFESQAETKQSDQSWLQGTVTMHIFWPPNLRRSDLTRVPAAFKAILEEFFTSQSVRDMLDELYSVQRPTKVYGLNMYGSEMSWTPNVQGMVADQAVPVTMVDVRYKIDLRAWYRALEFMGRTKDQPFQVILAALTQIGGEFDGIDGSVDPETGDPIVDFALVDQINVQNP